MGKGERDAVSEDRLLFFSCCYCYFLPVPLHNPTQHRPMLDRCSPGSQGEVRVVGLPEAMVQT
jgi:hypothetical protein